MFLEAQEMMGQGSRVPFAKCVERQEDDRLSELQCRCSELGGARGALRRTLGALCHGFPPRMGSSVLLLART